jgi:hypothetical protein
MSAVPVVRTRTEAKPQARVVSRVRPSIAYILLVKSVSFILIALMVYLSSSLFGQVMVEKARREGIRATIRAREARKAESVLRRRLDSLTSLSAVEEWAGTHGFLPPEQTTPVPARPAAPVAQAASATSTSVEIANQETVDHSAATDD